MAKTVKVTSAQVHAAKLRVKRSAASGSHVSPGVTAIANAKRPAPEAGWSAIRPGSDAAAEALEHERRGD